MASSTFRIVQSSFHHNPFQNIFATPKRSLYTTKVLCSNPSEVIWQEKMHWVIRSSDSLTLEPQKYWGEGSLPSVVSETGTEVLWPDLKSAYGSHGHAEAETISKIRQRKLQANRKFFLMHISQGRAATQEQMQHGTKPGAEEGGQRGPTCNMVQSLEAAEGGLQWAPLTTYPLLPAVFKGLLWGFVAPHPW